MFPRTRLIPTVLSGGGRSPIAAPDAAFSFLPFTIYANGDGTFSIGSWDISAQVSRSGGAVYVAKTGNDTTGDGTAGNPYLTIGKANTVLGATANAVVFVGAGKYGWSDGAPNNAIIAVNRSYVGVGDVSIDAYLAGGAWGLTAGKTNTYEATIAAPIDLMLDYGNLDANGDPSSYSLQVSVDNVESNESSYYYDSGAGKVYVHATGHGSPTANIRQQYSGSGLVRVTASNVNLYYENIKAYHVAISILNNGANTGALYMKNCRVMNMKQANHILISGYDAYLQSVQVAHTDGAGVDGIYGEARNTVVARIVTIDCKAWDCGNNAGANEWNGNTNHGAGINVDINGEYYENFGPNVGFINAGKAWMLGANVHDSLATANDVNCLLNEDSWLDTCISSGSTFDITVDAGHTVYLRNCTTEGNYTGAGTVTTY